MDPIAVMMDEHRFIEGVLNAAEGYAVSLEKGDAPSKDDLGRIVRFIREFADARHHGKEEDILFAALIENGFSREFGPVAVMLDDHDQARRLTAQLAGFAATPGIWTEAQRANAARVLRGYAELLRGHIWKEDNVLYPASKESLPSQVQAEVERKCTAFDEQRRISGEYNKLESLGKDLIQRYGGTVV